MDSKYKEIILADNLAYLNKKIEQMKEEKLILTFFPIMF